MADGMVDMKRSKAEREKESEPISKMDGEDYPYGLSVHLDHHSLKKLGLHDKLPKVGDKLHLHAHAHVTHVSASSHDGGKEHKRIELQLRHMKVGPKTGMGEGDTEKDQETHGKMKHAMDKALKPPKEEGSEDEGDGQED